MKIDLITRIQSMRLYERMRASALHTVNGRFNSLSEVDVINLPKCAETYNRLAAQSKADIFCFVEDDVEFLTDDWDRIVEELFLEYDPDILGVVGATEYHGGGYFESGRENSFGQIACNKSKTDESTWVRVLSPWHRYKPVKVIDGMLMFMRRGFWEKYPFDEKVFDELFYYDVDACLEADRVGITSEILVKHSKPPEMYGVYPPAMKPASAYEPLLLERHGLTKKPVGDQTCAFVSLDVFRKDGQTKCFEGFKEKYKCASAA